MALRNLLNQEKRKRKSKEEKRDEKAAVKAVLEVNYTEDDLLDAASDNQGNFNILTDELSFNLDKIILKPKTSTGANPKTKSTSQLPVMKLRKTVVKKETNLTLTAKPPGTPRMAQIPT